MAGKSREDLERQIGEQQREKERLREENARLERELERLREDRDRLQGERDRLERERDQLEKELETARRAAKRQAAPFSKGAPTPTPRRPGRKPGRRRCGADILLVEGRLLARWDRRVPARAPLCATRVKRTSERSREDQGLRAAAAAGSGTPVSRRSDRPSTPRCF